MEAPPAGAPLSPAAELAERFWDLEKRNITVNEPGDSTRASSIGNECYRAIFYEWTVPAGLRQKHGPALQAIFDLGHDFERLAIRRLEEMGAEIVQRGRPYKDKARKLSGTVDAKIRLKGWPRALCAEIKGLNPYTAGSITRLEHIREHKQAWVRKYYAQLQVYLYLDGSDMGVFVLCNKSSGEFVFIDCPADPLYQASLLEKAEVIKRAVEADEPPARTRSRDCQRCPFLLVCAPDVDYGPGVSVLEDEELQAILERRHELVEAHREYEALDKTAKERLKLLTRGEGEILTGEFVVVAKEISKRSYVVKETTYREFRIHKAGGKKS